MGFLATGIVTSARIRTILPRKWLYFMKLSCLFLSSLLLALNLLMANSGNTQDIADVKVSVVLKNEPLKHALRQIEEQSAFKFAYTESKLRSYDAFSLAKRIRTVKKTLEILLENTSLTFVVRNNTIVLVEKKDVAKGYSLAQLAKDLDGDVQSLQNEIARPKPINGVITNERGEPLSGATVTEKGTNNSVVTREDGSFTINTSNNNPILVVSYVGFASKEISVNNQSNVSIALTQTNATMNDVVVVGYGTQRKKDVTGSVVTIGAEKIRNQPVQSLDHALAGQMSGVQVTQPTGAPGGGARVRIRGVGSISSGTEPLYVVDGFPIQGGFDQNYNPLTTINPSDIESITVLKDASSTAIYGSRGSNGVVIITTKRGRSGKARIDVDVYRGVQNLERKIEMMNAQEFAEASIEGRNMWYRDIAGGDPSDNNDQRRARTTQGYAQIPSILTNPQYNTDWQDEFYRTAPISNYQISVSGGSERSAYAISGGYFEQEGIIPNTELKRYSLRTNIDAQVSNKLKVGISFSPTVRTQKVVDLEAHPCCGGTVLAALTFLPMLPLRQADGKYTTMTTQTDGWQIPENPLTVTKEENRNNILYRMLGTAFADYEIIKGLNYRITAGGDLNSGREDRFRSSRIGFPGAPVTVPSGYSNGSTSYNWLLENTLNFNRSFGEHSVNAITGYTTQKDRFYGTFVSAINFPNDLVTTLNAGQINGGNTNIQEWSLLSMLARVNYSFKNRYMLTGSFRRDGSSRFGANNRWGNFPSVGIAWRISQEDFMKDFPMVSELKLRGSYGRNGNNFISNYGSIGLIGSSNYILGGGSGSLANGLVPMSISNPDLTWETADQTDIGLELGLFNNRVFLTGEYYHRLTTGSLLNVPIPSITGFGNTLQNIGEIKNTGYELSVNTRNMVNEFQWSTDFNISFNRNKVLKLGPKGDPILTFSDIGDPTHRTQIGGPVTSFFGYMLDGVFMNQAEVDAGPKFPNVVTKPGDFRFKDVSGADGKPDGKIDANDRTTIGTPYPDYTFGLTNNFSFKGFDLSVLLQGSQGNDILFLQRRFHGFIGGSNAYKDMTKRWRSEQDPGDGKHPRANVQGNSTLLSSYHIEDGSYVRIRNLSLGYRLPSKMLGRLGVQSFRVYVLAQNLHTFTKFAGYNPEVSRGYGSPLQEGIDYGVYPLARTFTVGINASF